MKQIIYFSLLFIFTNSFAQNVTIPDVNFFNALKTAGVDGNNDNFIQTSEAITVKKLVLNGKSIANLTGIEAFTSLTFLACDTNQLTSLNLTANTLLDTLLCNNNQIASLDLSNNTGLKKLNCASNSYTAIDVTANTALVWFDCGGTTITSLDVSKNLKLEYLDIVYTNKLTFVDLSNNVALNTLLCFGLPFGGFNNSLTSLDVRNNVLLTTLIATNNPNLHKICINSNQLSTKISGWSKDASCSWNANPGCVGISTNIIESENLNTNQRVIKMYDILGNELNPTAIHQGVIIYLYEDGTRKKVLEIN